MHAFYDLLSNNINVKITTIMKTKLFAMVLIALTMTSCFATRQIKGTYPQNLHSVVSTLSVDEVWSKVIDFFATSGVPINVIDKSSGLIVSQKMTFPTTGENRDGTLVKESAYIVSPSQIINGIPQPVKQVAAVWNIRVKDVAGKTSISINLHIDDVSSVSTGVFEKQLLDLFK